MPGEYAFVGENQSSHAAWAAGEKMMQVIALFDWPSLSSSTMIEGGIEFLAPSSGFDVGIFQSDKKVSRKKDWRKVTQHLEIDGERASLELYGGVINYKDPESQWTDYLSCAYGLYPGKKELILAVKEAAWSPGSVAGFIDSLSQKGHLGYGFFSSRETGDARCFATGISTASSSDEEAEDDSRWLSERLRMGGASAKNRHLSGYFRDVFELNILNSMHVDNLVRVFSGTVLDQVREIGHGSFLWEVSEPERAASKSKLIEADLII